jgi:pimeloyl-ACP methyl ester carboxylesterase
VLLEIGGPVWVSEWDGPSSATIVCLHGVGGSALQWDAVAPRLARHGRVLALDHVGHGRTPRAGRSAAIGPAQQLLARVLRAEQALPAVLVGHSLGAALAVLEATRDPAAVRALVLTSPLLPPSRPGLSDRAALVRYVAGRAGQRARAARRSLGERPSLARTIERGLRGAAADPATIDAALVRESLALAQAVGARETARSFAEAARSAFATVARGRDLRSALDRIACPVLLVHGELDRTVPLAFAERVARDHREWTFAVLPGLGHVPQLEAPDRWADAVEPWLADVLRDGVRRAS